MSAPKPHPLSSLTASEISRAAELLRSCYPKDTELLFKVITLKEPPKHKVLPFLDAERAGKSVPDIDRKAFVNYYLQNTNKFHEAIVNLCQNTVERNVRLGPFIHSSGDGDEIIEVEKVVLKDEAVKAEIAKLKLPEGTVIVCDPWIYGSNGIDDSERMFQVFMYMRDPANSTDPDSCHYAHPLAISPVVDSVSMTVIRIDICPMGADNAVKPTAPYSPKPASEYVPEYQTLRTDLKPLHVVQPEGASFTVDRCGETDAVVLWQKWHIRVSFNHREGIVLHDIRYDDRALFYRVALSDMNIPYADPRHPFNKKSAFDLGDAGAGIMANDLQLGCDCLGSIYYLSGVLTTPAGSPLPMPNAVCIHEQDAGILWKHTNYRTGRAVVVRKRELVIQSIITVSNYEYVLAFVFNQAAELTYEVRATGILSTQALDDDGPTPDFGTKVHPGVLAAHHQHFFSLRLDPMLDGSIENTLIRTTATALPLGAPLNLLGNGYTTRSEPITHSSALHLDPSSNLTYAITNPRSLNPINGKPVAYKVQIPPCQLLLSHPNTFNAKRAEFATHPLFVTTYRDGELYAAGKYTNQSRGGTGVLSYVSRNEPVENADIVLWINFGINHIPRTEDFPVMPAETLRVVMKPVNFFVTNPAIDVPSSVQEFNRSTLARACCNGN